MYPLLFCIGVLAACSSCLAWDDDDDTDDTNDLHLRYLPHSNNDDTYGDPKITPLSIPYRRINAPLHNNRGHP